MQITKDEYDKISIPEIRLKIDKNLNYDVRYKKAWNVARNKLSNTEKKQFTDLPYFDKKIFEDIT